MQDKILEAESSVPKALSSLSENSLNTNDDYPSADVASDSENVFLVQSTSSE